MPPPRPSGLTLRFLLDENVPDGVGRTLQARGHDVHFGNRSLARGSADQLVAAAALSSGAILVSADHDMKRIAKAIGIDNRRFRTLNLLKLACEIPDAARKVGEAISVIEHEWECVIEARRRRLWVELQTSVIRIVRDTPQDE